ncbi:hypothetical protein Pmani_006675 [Petrolisthes manimaculis]|uniref:Uncharacterized protein n=1 Tax=Petrolisthes manimaculis TaxID=1843537 RepID=A0AAE1QCD4_9EUCA|nr:hypothetical protein Pmani_006675 [Petrolisthes manimaculis]
MTARNFPPSFWNSHYQPPPPPPPSTSSTSSSSSSSSRPPSLAPHHLAHSPGELYDPHHYPHHHHPHYPPGHHTDPWAAYSLSSQAYGARGVTHEVYPTLPSPSRSYPQYTPLPLQPHLPRLAPVPHQVGMSKSDGWGGRYPDHFTTAADLSHGLDPSSAYPTAAHYHSVTGGP